MKVMRYWLILPLAFCLTMASCNQQDANKSDEDSIGMAENTGDKENGYSAEKEDLQGEKAVEASEPATVTPVAEKKAEARPAPRPKAKPTVAPEKPKGKETIYVETYGAQGKVWGHVTLNGDRGSGTIHDADENTLSVTVTRHGNELFAIDQNSRQYVFKIKN